MHDAPKILLSGGGTLGPVTPLLAIAHEMKRQRETVDFVWVGTASGPERALVEAVHIPFHQLLAPKLDRHRWWTWPFLPFLFAWSLLHAWLLLRKTEPALIMTAGGYVSVPLVIAGWFMGIPSWVHQLDIVPGLANRIMAPFAKQVTVTWDVSKEYFSAKKTSVVGGVVRPTIWQGSAEKARDRFGLEDKAYPTIFVFGGGTGAASVNEAMAAIGPDIVEQANVIHLTGKGKMRQVYEQIGQRYVPLEFLGVGMADALALADIVVARAGMGTIMELAALKKPAIILPLQNTDQLANAQQLEERQAATVLHKPTPQVLKQAIEQLLGDDQRRLAYQRRMGMLFLSHGAEEAARIADDFLFDKK